MNEFDTFNFFPIIKNVQAQSIADSLDSVKPVTLDEVAAGRTIKQVNLRYDDFTSVEALKHFIVDKVKKNGWTFSDLTVAKAYSIPFIQDDPSVFYNDLVGSIQISALTFRDRFDDMPDGGTVFELNPRNWSIQVVERTVTEIIQEHESTTKTNQ